MKGNIDKYIGARIVLSLLLALTLFPSLAAAGPETGSQTRKVAAIVIDDLGNGMTGTEKLWELDYPITVAVMPFLRTTKLDAEEAHRRGYDVLVHMPMEPKRGNPSWLGPGAITTDLSDEEIRKRVERAIDDVPHAVGMNNHMGSKATADERVMRVVLETCKARGLFFLDSRTNYQSVVPKVGEEVGVPVLRNVLFLDDSNSLGAIRKQVRKMAKTPGTPHMIAIGHVGDTGLHTTSVLREARSLIGEDWTFVKISSLVQRESGPLGAMPY
ncbi:divergent polysaccharide deacetylase family protein [Paenibacillus thermoaerophilus]|uniref:Divergent polysaccharide deacetylase family protein n=1 Tax=Paenibacillus thermoaerophilus TaxID=1215385 RepID=A0ABW2V7X6_9BACL|nr:divergent polysaccharide deacetylase family protein [Paenibacillus thermoaerophilus]TMV17858.1 divergent polysaccharide deacetylase family protein [Paenibacillus thermoaerophilus]